MEDYQELHQRRSELRQEGRYKEAIPLQQRLIQMEEVQGSLRRLTNAWNYLSTLYLNADMLPEAEHAANRALAIFNEEAVTEPERLACYQMVLAQIYAQQGRRNDARTLGERSLKNYAVLHNPPDEFLRRMQERVQNFS